MKHVALLRNLNVGQRGHPSTAQILAAFTEVGAADALSFQSNGTVVFTAPPGQGESQAHRAVVALARTAGLEREVFTRPLDFLRPIVAAHGSTADAHVRELTLHGGPELEPDDPAVLEAERLARCTVLDAGPGWVVTLNHRERQSNGTPLVERVIGTPATSRGLPTLARLLDKVSSPT